MSIEAAAGAESNRSCPDSLRDSAEYAAHSSLGTCGHRHFPRAWRLYFTLRRSAPDARRPVRHALSAAFACVLALVVVCAPACRRGAATPNVVLVVVDTLRADRMSLYGYPRPTSPGLDEFARDAVVFDDAWSPASWTFPAHAGMFTGTAPHRLNLYDGLNAKLVGGKTLAERLSGAGFQTAAFTANPWVSPTTNLTRGFGTVRQMLPSDPEFPTADRVLDAMHVWIRDRRAAAASGRAAPWFAFANLMDCHAPYDAPAAESAQFLRAGLSPAAVAEARSITGTTGLVDASLGLRTLGRDLTTAMSDLYDADVAAVDAALTRFLSQLREDGTLDETLVIIASDHGEGLGDHGWREHGVRLHRELLRTLLVVRLPGRFDGGRRVASVVSLIDVTPTVLAACGLSPVGGADGHDLAQPAEDRVVTATDRPYGGWPWLANATLPDPARAHVVTRRFSAYDGRLHAIVDDHGGAELYDDVADPRELQNLAVTAPAVLDRMRAHLVQEFGAGAADR